MKKNVLVLTVLFIAICGFGQTTKYFTKSGHIYFISHTDIIDIDADNRQVGSVLDIETGEIVFSLLMKSFEFTLPLAEEHFNENYVESHKYPKSTFKGKIVGADQIDFMKQGIIPVLIEGELSIHGVTRKVSEKGELDIQEGKIVGKSQFSINLADYKIKVPRIVEDKVAKTIPLKIEMNYLPYK